MEQRSINEVQGQDDPNYDLRANFLVKHVDLAHVDIVPLQADASFRRYYRILSADKPCLLMEDRPPEPFLPQIKAYIEIGDHLRGLGLSAPEIFERDIEGGYLLIEDWADATYTNLFKQGQDEAVLYELATDALIYLHKQPENAQIDLPDYDEDALLTEAMLIPDWYAPEILGQEMSPDACAEYDDIMKALFKSIDTSIKTIVLRDYHVDNLMHLPERDGVKACGLLDFQGAVIGHPSYDLMSLLEDARRDVSKDLQQALLDRYFAGTGFERESFMASYAILAAQRHAKVVGIFVRLCRRDGKDHYLDYLPHVQNLLLSSLQNPVLEPLKKWFDKHEIDLTKRITK